MTNGLERAAAHIDQMLEQARFDYAALAIVPDHSRVQAYRYNNHTFEGGVLRIWYEELLDDSKRQHESRFRQDDNVYMLTDTEISFYHDARLMIVVLVRSTSSD